MKNIVIKFLFFFLFICETALAQWQMTSGPSMTAPKCIANIDSAIFLGTSGGIYKSIDEGLTWIPKSRGITNYSFSVMHVFNSIVYAGTSTNGSGVNDGLFKSSDFGDTWTKCKTGKIIQIQSFGNKLIIYADNGYFSSQDYGLTWQNEPYPNGFSADLYAKKNNELFACFRNGGIYSRHIADTIWTRKSNSVITDSSFESIAVKDSVLCVATTDDFFISTDLGGTWLHPANFGIINSPIFPLFIDSTFIYAGTNSGLIRTADNGNSWDTVYSGAVSCLLNYKNKLLLGNQDGLFSSNDHGSSWMPLYSIYSIVAISCLATKDSVILASSTNTIYYSADEGTSWNKTTIGNVNISSLLVIDSTVFAGTTSFGNGIYKKNWSDTSWVSVNNGLTGLNINVLVHYGNEIYAGTYSGLFSSSNFGQSWTILSSSSSLPYKNISSILVEGSQIFVGTVNGVYVTQNNGASWSLSPIPVPAATQILSLAIKDSTIFVGTFGYGIFVSNDHGVSWTASNSGFLGSNFFVRFISIIGSNIFVSLTAVSNSNIGILYLSTDNGASWSLSIPSINGTNYNKINSLAYNGNNIFTVSKSNYLLKKPLSQLPNSCAFTNTAKPYVCDYDSVLLYANAGPGFTYQWLKQGIPISGATSANYYAKQSGQYSCAFGGACVGSSPQFTLFGKAAPQPSISPPYDEICPQGDSALFFVDNPIPSYTYQWKHSSGLIPGATNQSYYAKIYGNYYCIVSDSFQCKGISNPVLLGFDPYADSLITAAGSTKICQGDSVRLDASNGVFSTHQWLFNGVAIPGALSPSYFAKQKGVYNCIETYNCVTLSTPIAITYTPDCYFIPHPDTLISNVWHIQNLCSGNSSLTYVWDWGDFTSSTGDSPAHLYSTTSKYNVCVTVTDSSGCSNSYCDSIYASAIYITPSLATNSSTTIGSINKVEIYPIPFSNELTIDLNTNDFIQIKIYNLFGNLIYQNQLKNKLTINSVGFAKGIYIVELSDDKTFVHRKVYKD